MPQPQVCPRCHRANPEVAVFCYFDGIVLQRAAHVSLPISSTGQLPHPFVFPSHRACSTMDELVEGLHYEWDDARDLLVRGKLGVYFTAINRLDLARAAKDAASHPDPDIGLYQFLQNLPKRSAQGPRLDLKPRRLNLNNVGPGDVCELPLHVYNLGQGSLQGKLSVAEGEGWVQVTHEPPQATSSNGQISLKTAKELRLLVRVDTRTLVAPASHHARLVVITNGGIAEVPIRLDLGSKPFARAPFRGVSTPREMAERMRAKPKQSVPCLENGEIRQWFDDNGWEYPVVGPQAKGVAGVQQFFEGMGLSRPPKLELSEEEIQVICIPPEVVTRQVRLRTNNKKWVYAHVQSDVPWLNVLTPEISGPQKAEVDFEVDSSLMDPDQLYEGTVTLTANAGQQFSVRVVVDVRRPHEPFTRRLLRPFFSLALVALLYRLCMILPADVYSRLLRTEETGTLAFWTSFPIDQDGAFLRSLVQATWWIGPIFGLALLGSRGTRWWDSFHGAIVGSMAGVVLMVTLGCVMAIVDEGPRWFLEKTWGDVDASSQRSFTAVWIVVVLVWWSVLGGVIGFVLGRFGKTGRNVIHGLAMPFAWPLRGIGLSGPAKLMNAD